MLITLGSVVRIHLGPIVIKVDGGVAQLGERLVCNQEVIGSIPFASRDVFDLLIFIFRIHTFIYVGFSALKSVLTYETEATSAAMFFDN